MNQDWTVEPTADTLTRQQQAVDNLPHQEASTAGAAKRATREFWPEVPEHTLKDLTTDAAQSQAYSLAAIRPGYTTTQHLEGRCAGGEYGDKDGLI